MPSTERDQEVETLRAQLAEAQEVIRAIQAGDVDAVVVAGPEGEQVFTLQGAEYAYRALVEAMNEGAATLGADGTVLYCNQRLSDLLGIPPEQIIGNHVKKNVAIEAMHDFDVLLAKAWSGESCKAELEFHTSKGDLIAVHVSLRKMALEAAELCMVVTDLTERKKTDELKRMQEILRVSEARFRSVLDSSRDFIYRTNVQTGCYEYISPSVRTVMGISPDELMSMGHESSLAMIHPDDLPAVQAWLARLEDTGEGELEYRLRTGNGEFRWLSNHASITRDSEDRALYRSGNVRDITEKKKAEEALLRSEKLASVGRMASTIAHEINNPLEAVGNALYLALTGSKIAEDTKSYLDMAVEELDRVSHITRQTLAFHHQTSTPTQIDLREMIDGALQIFAPRLKSRGVAIVKRTPPVGRIRGFGGEIQQIISNLLSNSMDAVPNNGRIEFRLSQISGNGDGCDKVRFTIADTGSGIPPDRLGKMFEPFFTTKEMHGTGLGLWVTKQIVEKHEASIRVRSKLGRGTVFSITFPVAEQAAVC